MNSTFGSFEIGRRAIHLQQKGAQVTGQNIANANTEGYARQVVHMKALVPPAVPGVVTPPGYGAAVSDITRIKSEFYEDQLRKSLTALNYWEAREETLAGIEIIFQEPGESGLNTYLSEFFDAWQELSVNPESFATRISLREQAVTLTSMVRNIYERMDDYRFDVLKELEAELNRVNSLAAEIAELNQKIVYLNALGKKSNEMLDERDLRLKELSELIDIRVIQKPNGSVEVLVGGRILLHDDRYFKLETRLNEDTGEVEIYNELGAKVIPQGGRFLGLVEAYNMVLPGYQASLDELVFYLVKEVNELHRKWFGLDGSTGIDFFDMPDEDFTIGRASLNFRVSRDILDNLSKIAASSGDSEPGNGQGALEIAMLREKLVMEEGRSTFQDYFRGLIAQLGVEGRESQRMSLAIKTVAEKMEEQQESIAGVSLDDEMLNLIQFQHAYNAAARYLSILDRMLDLLLTELGR